MQCSWCKRWGKCNPDDLRPWWIPGLWDIDGIGLLCDTCKDAGRPPHGRYLQAVLKVPRSAGELIAAYKYPVYAEAIGYAAFLSTGRRAMSHKRRKPGLLLQGTVIHLLQEGTRSNSPLREEIRRKGGENTFGPSIATHCVMTPHFPVDEVTLKRLRSDFELPDSCICVPDSFLYPVDEVLEATGRILAVLAVRHGRYERRRQRQLLYEAMSHTVTEGTQDAMIEAWSHMIPGEAIENVD